MLSPADAELIRRDSGLPGLGLLLDAQALARRLARYRPELRGLTLNCSYLRYKPGTNCLAAYRVESVGSAAGAFHVYAKAFRSNADPKLWNSVTVDDSTSPGSVGIMVLPEAAVAIRIFPDDHKLASLSILASPQRGELLRKLLPDRAELWETVPRVLRYKPERRCVLRLDGSHGALASIRCYTPSEFAKTGSQVFRSTGSLRVPQQLGRSRRHQLMAFEWLPGQPLAELLDSQPACVLRRIGRALAELHLQDVHGLPFTTRRGEARRLQATAGGLAVLCPSLATRCIRLAHGLAERLLAAPAMVHPLHGDFYAEQVLVSADDIAVLDLDEAVFGEAAADLGQFIADLDLQAVAGRFSAGEAEVFAGELLEGYGQTAGVTRERVALYRSAALLRLAHHPFRSRHPDWPQQTEALIALAEDRLPPAPKSVRPQQPAKNWSVAMDLEISDPFGVAVDPQLSFAAPALNPVEVVRRLRHSLSRPTGSKDPRVLREIRVIRHIPGRRCLIEYTVGKSQHDKHGGATTLIGKIRAKRLDAVSYRVQQALFNGSFGREAADGVMVPEPLGIVPDWHMWLQRKMSGQRATQLLETDSGVTLAARLAEAIWKLHRAPPPLRHRHSPRDELRILHERLPKVSRRRRQWREPLQRILDACVRLAARLPQNETACIHRDFYPDQVLVAADSVVLLDLDLCCQGDPALDIGNFDAHLTEQALRRFGRMDALNDVQLAFVDRYTELAGEPMRPRIAAYSVLALVRHISISTRIADRRHLTEPLIELSAERLDVRLKTGCFVSASHSSPTLTTAGTTESK